MQLTRRCTGAAGHAGSEIPSRSPPPGELSRYAASVTRSPIHETIHSSASLANRGTIRNRVRTIYSARPPRLSFNFIAPRPFTVFRNVCVLVLAPHFPVFRTHVICERPVWFLALRHSAIAALPRKIQTRHNNHMHAEQPSASFEVGKSPAAAR